MKKTLKWMKNNILICDVIFIIFNVSLSFILYLCNIKFRLWFLLLIILICVIGFFIGIIQSLYKVTNNKIKSFFLGILYFSPAIILVILFMPIISLFLIFSYKPEHVVTIDNRKYVAVVKSFLYVNVDYYNYYGPFLMGTEIKIHGYFGKGGFDPYENSNKNYNVEYTYYDNNGKVTTKKEIINSEDKDNTSHDDVYEEDFNEENFNINDDYILPEDEEVLYEKEFQDTILRFSKLDNCLARNMLVNVLESKDNGKSFNLMTKDPIQVSLEAKFIFLNEKQGFAISNGKIYLDDGQPGIYVTNDSGKTFNEAKFEYKNDNVEYISIEGLPYYDKNVLKLECSVYQINSNRDGYENKKLIFISNNNGLTWNLENN